MRGVGIWGRFPARPGCIRRVSPQGKLYRGFLDCFAQISSKEGLLGLYKGIGAVYLRLGPHTVLSLCFWLKEI